MHSALWTLEYNLVVTINWGKYSTFILRLWRIKLTGYGKLQLKVIFIVIILGVNLLHADSPSAAVVLVWQFDGAIGNTFFAKSRDTSWAQRTESVPEKQSQWQDSTLLESITHWESVWLPAENLDTTLALWFMDQKACSSVTITLQVHQPHRGSMGNLMQNS